MAISKIVVKICRLPCNFVHIDCDNHWQTIICLAVLLVVLLLAVEARKNCGQEWRKFRRTQLCMRNRRCRRARTIAQKRRAINLMFPNLFSRRKTRSQAIIRQSDGDQCCTTLVQFKSYPSLTKNSKDYALVNFVCGIDLYQYVPMASCIEPKNCVGTCEEKTVPRCVLVYDGPQMAFHMFDLNTYCSCQSSG